MQKTLSPPEYARILGIKVERIHGWIRSGALVAINVSDSCRRPLWRITPEAIERFEQSRSSRPPVKPPQRRKKDPSIIEFY